ncbi:MAG TPA: metalloregulator ArsR/SmtB family transcription factor [Symbiobacteriaceae bacterium]|nr:metalloregulator ArsR/SmtB family transcription factor [Symbiobacteriaceae bacterium]
MALDLQVLERQAEICKALGHPKRLQIIYLLERGETTAGDLAAALNTTPANVSQHLNAMRQAGLVGSRREASNVIYWLTTPAIIDACAMVKQILTEQVQREQDLLGRTLKR